MSEFLYSGSGIIKIASSLWSKEEINNGTGPFKTIVAGIPGKFIVPISFSIVLSRDWTTSSPFNQFDDMRLVSLPSGGDNIAWLSLWQSDAHAGSANTTSIVNNGGTLWNFLLATAGQGLSVQNANQTGVLSNGSLIAYVAYYVI